MQTENGYKSEHAQAVTFGLQKATSKISMKESIKILITGQKPTWTTQIIHGVCPAQTYNGQKHLHKTLYKYIGKSAWGK